MTSETDYRGKMRAVFLAAIMVVSMVGMSVAFAGATAANPSQEAVYTPDFPYQGQDVTLENDSIDDTEQYELRVVDSFDGGEVDSSSFVRELDDVDGDFITIETDDLEADDYFVRGDGLERNPPESETFEVRVQDLDAEFDDDEVTDAGPDSVTEFEVDSNRGTYSTVVDAGDGDLDNDELLDVYVTEENTDLASGESFEINDSAGDGEIDLDSPADSNITVENYKEILGDSGIQDLVDFEDEDVTEPLNISADDPLSNFTSDDTITIEEDDLTDFDDDIVINTTTTWGDITSPTDEDINPFNALLIADDQDEEDDPEDRIVMLDISDTDADVDFADIDAGDYTFNVNVADTEASASADITVREEDQDGDFSQGTYSAGAGDIAHFEFDLDDTDSAWVKIGDADADFADVLYIEVDDDSEDVEVAVNTRLLGAPGADVETDAVYDYENTDEFSSLLHDDDNSFSDFEDQFDAQLFHDDGTDRDVDEYYDDLDLVDEDDVSTPQQIREEMLTRPVQAIDYELQLAGDGDDDGIFDSDAGAGEASDQLDASVLELQAASIGEINTWVAPEEDADDVTDVDELLDIVTQRDEVADGDRLVIQVEATGLYGGLIAGGPDSQTIDPDETDFDRLSDGVDTNIVDEAFSQDNINFDVEAEDITGQDPISVELESDDEDAYMLIGPDQEQFFLVVNSDSDDAFDGSAPESTAFTAELEYDADDFSDRFEFEGDNVYPDDQNYPYLQQGETLEGSAAFEFVVSEISFDNLNADDEVQAENIEDSEISGTTNIAPGSDATVRVSSTDASTSFRIGQDVDIEEDGTVSAEYDFSGQEVGDEFDTRFRASGSTIDTVASVIVAEGDLGVEEPVEDDEADDEDDVVEDDDDEVVDDDDDVEEPTDDETPGFGALVALVALIGAALLAVRRQNN